jgi:hypothetical protein
MDESLADKPVKIEFTWQKKFLDSAVGFACPVTLLGGGLLLFISAFTLVLQVYQYLKTGVWPHWVLFGVLMEYLPGPFVQWIVSPTDWIALHQIVWWIFLQCPTWFIALVLAVVWFACGAIVKAYR